MKRHLGSILMMSAALLSALAFYLVSLNVSAERAAVDALKRSMAEDLADMKALEAELRTRARLPQLQRWNEEVLALGPPGPKQFLGDPVQLASYAAPLAAPAPVVAAVAERVVPISPKVSTLARVEVAALAPARAKSSDPSTLALALAAPAPAPGSQRAALAALDPQPPAPSDLDLSQAIARELEAVSAAGGLQRVSLR